MINKCWLCNEIKNNIYKEESEDKTLSLEMLHIGDKFIIKAEGNDNTIAQQIKYCPICGKKLK